MRVGGSIALALALAASGSACIQLGTYACGDGHGCNEGRCEPTGYCSYPDLECPSGQRYDDLAPPGLANTCVEEGATSTAMSSSTNGSTSTSTTDSDETSSESGSSSTTAGEVCPPEVDCVDLDEDGFGAGSECDGLDCDDANPATYDGCVYVGPDGDDTNVGTRDAPWATFAHALQQLEAGESLVLLDGTYTERIAIDCRASAMDPIASGTADAPIFLRAENERRAELAAQGNALSLLGCDAWRIHGLYAHSEDVEGSTSHLVLVDASRDIRFDRVLLRHPNAFDPLSNVDALHVVDSSDVVIEEGEVYDFHNNAITFEDSQYVTVRRSYLNGIMRTAGNGGIVASPDVVGPLIDNCVVEHAATGFVLSTGAADGRLSGSIAMDVYYGFRVTTFHESQNSLGNEIVDFLAMDCDRGALVTAAGSTSVRRATLLDARDYGLRVEGPLLGCAQAGCTITVQDSLVLGSEETGVEIGWTDPKVTPEVLVSHSNAFGTVEAAFPPDEPFDDMRGILQSNLSQDVDAIGLGNGECIVRPPDGTVLDGAASDGGTIGARILYRYVDGTETEAPLWDPGFPCGAVVPGVNDDLAFSCENLHNRINAGTHGCTLPYDDPGPCPH